MSIKCESGVQLLMRLRGRPNLKNFCDEIFGGNLEYKDVIEICGQNGSGKTELLIHIIANCILPEEFGGLNSSVLFIDTDRNFDLLRLVAVLEFKLSLYKGLSVATKDLITQYLQKLLIVQLNDASQMMLTLHYLNDYLLNRTDVIFLMIDSITNFYWLERMMVDDNLTLVRSREKVQIDLLQKLIDQFGLTLIVTRQMLYNSKGADKGDQPLSELMSRNSWQKFVTSFISMSFASGLDASGKQINLQLVKNKIQINSKFEINNSGLVKL